MAQKVLLISESAAWLKTVRLSLQTTNVPVECEEAAENNGLQRKMKQSKFATILLDPDISGGRSIEILKYVKLNYPCIRISLVFEDKTREQELHFLKESREAAGIAQTVTLSEASTINLKWDPGSVPEHRVESRPEFGAEDKDFVAIPIEGLSDKNVALFDYYIRLKEHQFVPIVRKNDVIDPVRIAALQDSGVRSVHIKIKPRKAYIKRMNELKKMSRSVEKANFRDTIAKCNSLSDLLLGEVHTQGLPKELVSECKAYCDTVGNLVRNNYRLGQVHELFLDMDATKLSKSFIVTFLSAVICKHLEWAGQKTMETIAMGALLHDIGIGLLPEELRTKERSEMTEEELKEYQKHPRLGANLLLNNPNINTQVTQIVFQNHENNLGTGYPNRIASQKIYPPAKIVGLAEEVGEMMVTDMIPPLEAIKIILQDRERVLKFDPAHIKALVAAFKVKK